MNCPEEILGDVLDGETYTDGAESLGDGVMDGATFVGDGIVSTTDAAGNLVGVDGEAEPTAHHLLANSIKLEKM